MITVLKENVYRFCYNYSKERLLKERFFFGKEMGRFAVYGESEMGDWV